MKLATKLLGYLQRIFNKDPAQFLALRLQYGGGMTWQVSDGFLTTTVTGGIGQNLSVDLSQYTLGALVGFLSQQPGYEILYVDQTGMTVLSSLVLLDASNDIALSNGDHLYGYTSLLKAWLESTASEMKAARAQIPNALQQISTTTAQGEWLDLLGGQYYGVKRNAGEVDVNYSPRIIATVLRAKGNNVAIEAAISEYTGQSVTVTDVTVYGPVFPSYNGAISYNGSHNYLAATPPLYGLFDVTYGYDLINGGDISSFQTTIEGLVEQLRDAGTHFRALVLSGSALSDPLTGPTDGGALALSIEMPLADALTAPTDSTPVMTGYLAGMLDTLTPPADSAVVIIAYDYRYDGIRRYDGKIFHLGAQTVVEPLTDAGGGSPLVGGQLDFNNPANSALAAAMFGA